MYRSFKRSSIKEPTPEPVPPAIEWHRTKPLKKNNLKYKPKISLKIKSCTSSESLFSASLSIISNISSYNLSP
jgi:hypothetical protein